MKKSLFILGASAAALFAAPGAIAQDAVVVEEETVVVTENVPCKTHYYTTKRDNWFIQIGAGINAPMVDNALPKGKDGKIQMTAAYNFGFGKWFSPYLGWRFNAVGGAIHWQNINYDKAKYVNASVELMWDMFNSFKVNPRRVFSIVPFVGVGGTYVWDYINPQGNDLQRNGKVRKDQWLLPVSAGIQFRLRLCKYVDFFAEGRFQLYGDNFNNTISGNPIEANLTAIGGFNFNIGGSDFRNYNPCDYLGYINTLNNQVNDLRGELATTAAALAAAEAQLPCPEVTTAPAKAAAAPLLSTVRFKINSDVIEDYEQVNVYNIAQWMKANPNANVTIAGYADKDTGTSEYNMALSKRRAEAVRSALVNDYGINPDRLSTEAQGSSVQPYSENNWNRIVIFSNK
ncbi:MAG: OmpA family protein [Muribaculaceae bacterium]